ncbi:MAG: Asp-tRNA(Asn)/Glu-tRNA(Gln) amidotransferase subunit GatC [Candidatus Nealsonbacteria bacterium DGGOD1a]|jgi:glutamyl-tRNA(Gln) and/or aspartyl-tRNA(Asn) amidotransferase, C subunit|nr:MAG: Asp-tRNA(Asn)/Glu-tRNA(Gln) amidotransferase subunit GatC [Candidatus Nealsonbacteria bacterium DGGOD1a]
MLSKQETQHIAKLARLGLSEEEIVKYQKDLSDILGYIDKLKEVDIEGVAPFTHSIEVANVLRPDAKIERTKEELGKLRSQMPQTKDGYLKVRSIFETKAD